MKKLRRILFIVLLALLTMQVYNPGKSSASVRSNFTMFTLNIIKVGSKTRIAEKESDEDTLYESYKDDNFKENFKKKFGDDSILLNGAKFYYFLISDDKAFHYMTRNPQKYDSLEKLKEMTNFSGETNKGYGLKGIVRFPKEKQKYDENTNIFFMYQDYKSLEEFFAGILDNKTKNTEINSQGITGKKDKEGKIEGDEGVVTFYIPERANYNIPPLKKRENIWVIEEKSENLDDAADISDSTAVPFGIELPFRGKEGEMAESINVYPKNVINNKVTKEKTVEDERSKFKTIDNYQDFSWFLQANIPAGDFTKLTKLEFNDIAYKDTKEINSKVILNGFNFRIEPPEVYIKEYNNPDSKMIKLNGNEENNTKEGDRYKYKIENIKTGKNNDGVLKDFHLEFINPPESKTIFTEDEIKKLGINPEKEYTVFVKVRAKFEDGYIHENKKQDYNKTSDFEGDLFNENIEIEKGIGDDALYAGARNDFELKYSHVPNVDKDKLVEAKGNKILPEVKTGGKKFIKYADSDKEKDRYRVLKGARFLVKRKRQFKENIPDSQGDAKKLFESYIENNDEYKNYKSPVEEYLIIKDGKKKWINSSSIDFNNINEEGLYKNVKNTNDKYNGTYFYTMNSDERGFFELRGLEYSNYEVKFLKYKSEGDNEEVSVGTVNNDYSLVEIKAPEGYQLSGEDIKFKIDDNSHMPPEKNSADNNGENIFYGEEDGKNSTLDADSKKIFEPSLEHVNRVNASFNTYSMKSQESSGTVSKKRVKRSISNWASKVNREFKSRQKIKNFKPIIPNTGSYGAALVIICGLGLMGYSGYRLLKRRKHSL